MTNHQLTIRLFIFAVAIGSAIATYARTMCERADDTIRAVEQQIDNADTQSINVKEDADLYFFLSVFETIGDYRSIHSGWHNAIASFDPEKELYTLTAQDAKRLIEWYRVNQGYFTESMYNRYATLENILFDPNIPVKQECHNRLRKSASTADKEAVIRGIMSLITEFQDNKYGKDCD